MLEAQARRSKMASPPAVVDWLCLMVATLSYSVVQAVALAVVAVKVAAAPQTTWLQEE